MHHQLSEIEQQWRSLFPDLPLEEMLTLIALHRASQTMLREHDQAGELLAQLRAATDGYRVPDDACASYTALYAGLEELEADTHLHVHKENNLLFPAVMDLEVAMSA